MNRKKILVCTVAALFLSLLLVTGFGLAACTSGFNVNSGTFWTLGDSAQVIQVKQPRETVTIVRDIYGIPHINASSHQGAFFGFGYVQAEDAIESVMLNLITSSGTLSKIFGIDGYNNTWSPALEQLSGAEFKLSNVESDVFLRQLKIPVSLSTYLKINETIRQVMIEPFAAGINYYIYKHWNELPLWIKEAAPVKGTDIASMAALINFIFSADVLGEWMAAESYINAMGVEGYLATFQGGMGLPLSMESHILTHGSNEWVVGAERSATGSPMYQVSPQIGWDYILQWYEAHLMAPAQGTFQELNILGTIFLGLPFIGTGHNGYIAWSETVNQPDIGDVWIENLTSTNTHYYHDGIPKPIIQETIKLPVKIPGLGVIEIEQPAYYTHHGVLLTFNSTDHWALAVNYSANQNSIGFEQFYLMDTAQNLTQFKQAMSMLGVAMFNIMFASVYNETYYVWNAMCPKRNENYDWTKAVPGWLTDTDWNYTVSGELDMIPFGELPQQENPVEGWMQNCNIPAWNITTQPNNITDNMPYPLYLVNWGGDQGMDKYSRGWMIFHIFKENDPITLDLFLGTTFNNSIYYFATDCIDQLPDHVYGDGNETLNNTIHTLKGWDKYATNQNATTIFRLWMYQTNDIVPENESYAISTLNNTITYMLNTYGTTDVKWADVHYVIRGSYKVGLNGTDSFGCLNARWSNFNSTTGEWEVFTGNSIIMIVNLELGNVTSWSVVPYGNSNNPNSPHYADMLLNWFSKDMPHPDFFYDDDILTNSESSSELPVYSLNETIQLINMLPFIIYMTPVLLAQSIASQQANSYLIMGGIASLILIMCVAVVEIATRRP